MIRFSLRCANDHGFESWFRSAEAYERLHTGGRTVLPRMRLTRVEKARDGAECRPCAGDPTGARRPAARRARSELRLARRSRRSPNTSAAIPRRGPRIHEGDAPERSIWGEASPEEARALVEDGVPMAPLPFMPPAQGELR